MFHDFPDQNATQRRSALYANTHLFLMSPLLRLLTSTPISADLWMPHFQCREYSYGTMSGPVGE